MAMTRKPTSSRPLSIPYPELNAKLVMHTASRRVGTGLPSIYTAAFYRDDPTKAAWSGCFLTRAAHEEAIQKAAKAMKQARAAEPVLKVTEYEYDARVADDAYVCLTCGSVHFEGLDGECDLCGDLTVVPIESAMGLGLIALASSKCSDLRGC